MTLRSVNGSGTRLIAKIGVACLLGTVAAAVAAAPTSAQPAAAYADYIVVLDESATLGAKATSVAQRFGTEVEHTYSQVFDGFSLRLSDRQARALAREGGVAYVVADTPVRAMGEQLDPPSWGLDRIDQRSGFDNRYWYPNEAESVHAYVIDTGIADHADFAGRVAPGIDFIDDDTTPVDGNGHGTFVSGILGGAEYGVAKKINIVPVKVLDDNGAGSMADVIAGIDWVTQNAIKPAVANMSLGGSANQALDDAVRASIASGVSYAVAAGGSATDAGNFSPARVSEALTIGASDMNDCVSSSSNTGSVVDMFAPGASINGPWPGGGTQTLSGSSLSAPHVAGAVGLYLHDNPTASPADVAAALTAAATEDALCNVPPGTANRLLYTGP
jgi:hypothetical protein